MKRKYDRLVALFTLLTFLVSQLSSLGYAQPSFSEVPAAAPYFDLKIPASLGRVEKIFAGQGPAVLHIQTAHGNFEAQKNIQAILHQLKNDYGVKTLFIEGSAFKLRPEMLRLFPGDMPLTMAVAEDLTRQALVKGPELFLLEDKEAAAYGMEKADVYAKNLAAFKAVLTEQKNTENFLRDMEMQIERLTSPYFGKDLRSFLKRFEDFESHRISITEWLAYLKQQAQKNLQLDFSDPALQVDWPMLVRMAKLEEFESKLDHGTLEGEKKEFLKAIRNIPAHIFEPVQELLNGPLTQQALPDPETELLFEQMVKALPRDFQYQKFPQVNLWIGHLILQSEIKGELLVEEMETLAGVIAESQAATDLEKSLLKLLSDHRLLQKLFALELTPSDYEKIKSVRKPSALAQRLLEINSHKRVKNTAFSHLGEIDSLYQKSLEFYSLVKARDGFMLENIQKTMKENKIEKAAVITGGFHTEPFRHFFENRGYRYALISPKMTTTDGREAYIQSILHQSSTETPSFGMQNRNELRAVGLEPSDLEYFSAALDRSVLKLSGKNLRSEMRSIAELIEQLGDRNASSRDAAFVALVVRGQESVPALQEALKSKVRHVAPNAKDALVEIEKNRPKAKAPRLVLMDVDGVLVPAPDRNVQWTRIARHLEKLYGVPVTEPSRLRTEVFYLGDQANITAQLFNGTLAGEEYVRRMNKKLQQDFRIPSKLTLEEWIPLIFEERGQGDPKRAAEMKRALTAFSKREGVQGVGLITDRLIGDEIFFEPLLKAQFGNIFRPEFEFYSYKVGAAKSDGTLFPKVLEALRQKPAYAKIKASEILIVDDRPENLERAQALGYQTLHFKYGQSLKAAFEQKFGRAEMRDIKTEDGWLSKHQGIQEVDIFAQKYTTPNSIYEKPFGVKNGDPGFADLMLDGSKERWEDWMDNHLARISKAEVNQLRVHLMQRFLTAVDEYRKSKPWIQSEFWKKHRGFHENFAANGFYQSRPFANLVRSFLVYYDKQENKVVTRPWSDFYRKDAIRSFISLIDATVEDYRFREFYLPDVTPSLWQRKIRSGLYEAGDLIFQFITTQLYKLLGIILVPILLYFAASVNFEALLEKYPFLKHVLQDRWNVSYTGLEILGLGAAAAGLVGAGVTLRYLGKKQQLWAKEIEAHFVEEQLIRRLMGVTSSQIQESQNNFYEGFDKIVENFEKMGPNLEKDYPHWRAILMEVRRLYVQSVRHDASAWYLRALRMVQNMVEEGIDFSPETAALIFIRELEDATPKKNALEIWAEETKLRGEAAEQFRRIVRSVNDQSMSRSHAIDLNTITAGISSTEAFGEQPGLQPRTARKRGMHQAVSTIRGAAVTKTVAREIDHQFFRRLAAKIHASKDSPRLKRQSVVVAYVTGLTRLRIALAEWQNLESSNQWVISEYVTRLLAAAQLGLYEMLDKMSLNPHLYGLEPALSQQELQRWMQTLEEVIDGFARKELQSVIPPDFKPEIASQKTSHAAIGESLVQMQRNSIPGALKPPADYQAILQQLEEHSTELLAPIVRYEQARLDALNGVSNASEPQYRTSTRLDVMLFDRGRNKHTGRQLIGYLDPTRKHVKILLGNVGYFDERTNYAVFKDPVTPVRLTLLDIKAVRDVFRESGTAKQALRQLEHAREEVKDLFRAAKGIPSSPQEPLPRRLMEKEIQLPLAIRQFINEEFAILENTLRGRSPDSKIQESDLSGLENRFHAILDSDDTPYEYRTKRMGGLEGWTDADVTAWRQAFVQQNLKQMAWVITLLRDPEFFALLSSHDSIERSLRLRTMLQKIMQYSLIGMNSTAKRSLPLDGNFFQEVALRGKGRPLWKEVKQVIIDLGLYRPYADMIAVGDDLANVENVRIAVKTDGQVTPKEVNALDVLLIPYLGLEKTEGYDMYSLSTPSDSKRAEGRINPKYAKLSISEVKDLVQDASLSSEKAEIVRLLGQAEKAKNETELRSAVNGAWELFPKFGIYLDSVVTAREALKALAQRHAIPKAPKKRGPKPKKEKEESDPKKEGRAEMRMPLTFPVWESIRRELEAHDPHLAEKANSAAFLPRLYYALQYHLNGIQEKIDKGIIFPEAFLKTNVYGKTPRQGLKNLKLPPGRRLRVGYLAVSGNPINWGHILVALASMNALELDTVVFRIQGEITYKDVPASDRVSAADRHAMGREVLPQFWPLIRGTDVGSKPGDAREGSEHLLFFSDQVNQDLPIDFHYILGAENEARTKKYLEKVYGELQRTPLSSAHRLFWTIMQRGEYGKILTEPMANQLAQDIAKEMNVTPLPVRLVKGGNVDLNVSSTGYRSGDSSMVPALVEKFAQEKGYYGYRRMEQEDGSTKILSREEGLRLDYQDISRDIARVINRKMEQKNYPAGSRESARAMGVFMIDGPSGTGKTTAAQEIGKALEKNKPAGYQVLPLEMDFFLKDSKWRRQLEETVTANPAQEYLNEETSFRADDSRQFLKQLEDFQKSGAESITLEIDKPYFRLKPGQKIEDAVPSNGRYDAAADKLYLTFTRQSLVLITAKYGLRYEPSPGFFDLKFRVKDNPGRAESLFQKRVRLLRAEDEDRSVIFYRLALGPSYNRYAAETQPDYELNLERELFELLPVSEEAKVLADKVHVLPKMRAIEAFLDSLKPAAKMRKNLQNLLLFKESGSFLASQPFEVLGKDGERYLFSMSGERKPVGLLLTVDTRHNGKPIGFFDFRVVGGQVVADYGHDGEAAHPTTALQILEEHQHKNLAHYQIILAMYAGALLGATKFSVATTNGTGLYQSLGFEDVKNQNNYFTYQRELAAASLPPLPEIAPRHESRQAIIKETLEAVHLLDQPSLHTLTSLGTVVKWIEAEEDAKAIKAINKFLAILKKPVSEEGFGKDDQDPVVVMWAGIASKLRPLIYEETKDQLKKAAELIELDKRAPEVLGELLEPERVLAARFKAKMDDGTELEFYGTRVISNSARGTPKGGLRGEYEEVDDEYTLYETKMLAFRMVWKFPLVDIGFGGAKGTILLGGAEKKSFSNSELASIFRGYVKAMMEEAKRQNIENGDPDGPLAFGPYIDVPAPDLNTSVAVEVVNKVPMTNLMDIFLDAYLENLPPEMKPGLENVQPSENPIKTPFADHYFKLLKEDPSRDSSHLGVVTGKSVGLPMKNIFKGGSRGREEATGQGALFSTLGILQYLPMTELKKLGFETRDLKGKAFTIQGSGNVGMQGGKAFARGTMLVKGGAKIVGMSDFWGTIKNPKGLELLDEEGKDGEVVIFHKHMNDLLGRHRASGGTFQDFNIQEAADLFEWKNGTIFSTDRDDIIDVPADFHFPAFREKQIHAGNAERYAKAKKVIIEGANNPTTPAADKILAGRVLIVPDIQVNAGGGTVSGFEWQQNLTNEHWPQVIVEQFLLQVMTDAAKKVLDIYLNLRTEDLRTAANIYSLMRVADAAIARNPEWREKYSSSRPPYLGYSEFARPETLDGLNALVSKEKSGDSTSLYNQFVNHEDDQLKLKVKAIVNDIVSRRNAGQPIRWIILGGPPTTGKKTYVSEMIVQALRDLHLPVDYVYTTDKPLWSSGAKERKDETIIVAEGSMALSSVAMGEIPKEQRYTIFAYENPSLTLKDNHPLLTTHMGLISDILYGTKVKNKKALDIITNWPKTREAVINEIYPTREYADASINLYLGYELPLLKKAIMKKLKEAKRGARFLSNVERNRAFKTINDLTELLDPVLSLNPTGIIAPASMLGQFLEPDDWNKEFRKEIDPGKNKRLEVRDLAALKAAVSRNIVGVYRIIDGQEQIVAPEWEDVRTILERSQDPFEGRSTEIEEVSMLSRAQEVRIADKLSEILEDLAGFMGVPALIEAWNEDPFLFMDVLDFFYQDNVSRSTQTPQRLMDALWTAVNLPALGELFKTDLKSAMAFLSDLKKSHYVFADLRFKYPDLVHEDYASRVKVEERVHQFTSNLMMDFPEVLRKAEVNSRWAGRMPDPEIWNHDKVKKIVFALLDADQTSERWRDPNFLRLQYFYKELKKDGLQFKFFAALRVLEDLRRQTGDLRGFWAIEDFHHTIYWRTSFLNFLVTHRQELELTLEQLGSPESLQRMIDSLLPLYQLKYDQEGLPLGSNGRRPRSEVRDQILVWAMAGFTVAAITITSLIAYRRQQKAERLERQRLSLVNEFPRTAERLPALINVALEGNLSELQYTPEFGKIFWERIPYDHLIQLEGLLKRNRPVSLELDFNKNGSIRVFDNKSFTSVTKSINQNSNRNEVNRNFAPHFRYLVIKAIHFRAEGRVSIDASKGEGGGQVIRTSAALSAITKKPVELRNIRMNRLRLGLRTVHTANVDLLAKISGAKLVGNKRGSLLLEITPGTIQATEQHDIDLDGLGASDSIMGTVFQSLISLLSFAPGHSSVTIKGGTHIENQIPLDHVRDVLLPLLRRMGVDARVELLRYGWWGSGGEANLSVRPVKEIQPLSLTVPGELQKTQVTVYAAGFDLKNLESLKEQILLRLSAKFPPDKVEVVVRDVSTVSANGPAIFISLDPQYQNTTAGGFEVFAKNPQEAIGKLDALVNEFETFHRSGAAVDKHVADMLVFFMALAKGESVITVPELTPHFLTNLETIQAFLPEAHFEIENQAGFHTVRVKGAGYKNPQAFNEETRILERLSLRNLKETADPAKAIVDAARRYKAVPHSADGYKTFRELVREAFKVFPPRPRILSVVGLSGSGKTTVVQKILADHPDKFKRLVRTTTRPLRPEDPHLGNHRFLSVEEFQQDVEENFIVAPRFNAGHHYGYSLDDILEALIEDKVIVMEALNSAKALKKLWPKAQIRIVGIMPVRYEGETDEAYADKAAQVLADRIKRRDSSIPDTEVQKRLHESGNITQIRKEANFILLNPDGVAPETFYGQFEAFALRGYDWNGAGQLEEEIETLIELIRQKKIAVGSALSGLEEKNIRETALWVMEAHKYQYRRDGVTPYFVHQLAVTRLLVEKFNVTDVLAIQVSLLHDTREDQKFFYDRLKIILERDVEGSLRKNDAINLIRLGVRLLSKLPEAKGGEKEYYRRLVDPHSVYNKESSGSSRYTVYSDEFIHQVQLTKLSDRLANLGDLIHLFKAGVNLPAMQQFSHQIFDKTLESFIPLFVLNPQSQLTDFERKTFLDGFRAILEEYAANEDPMALPLKEAALQALLRLHNLRPEMRIEQVLRGNRQLSTWFTTLQTLREKDKTGLETDEIVVKLSKGENENARSVVLKLPVLKVFFEPKHPLSEWVHRYLAGWIYYAAIQYGADTISINPKGLASLTEIKDLLLHPAQLGNVRDSQERIIHDPFGIRNYANAGMPIQFVETTEELQAKNPERWVSSQKMILDYPGTYVGVDIGGGSAKFGVWKDGKQIKIPDYLTRIPTKSEPSNAESGAEYVQRVIDHLLRIAHVVGKINGVGIVMPGAADLDNNRMATLGQIPNEKGWMQAEIEEVYALTSEISKALDAPAIVRNDMDGVLTGIAAILEKAKPEFWNRTKGNFRLDWMGTGHGHQFAMFGLPMPGPTEGGHAFVDFGRPGDPIYDTESYTSIPNLIRVAIANGFPEAILKKHGLKPIGDSAAGLDYPQYRNAAMAALQVFAKYYAQNLILGYLLTQNTGIGNGADVLLGGGITLGETGALLKRLTEEELAKLGFEDKIRIEVFTETELNAVLEDPALGPGPFGSSILSQQHAAARLEAHPTGPVLRIRVGESIVVASGETEMRVKVLKINPFPNKKVELEITYPKQAVEKIELQPNQSVAFNDEIKNQEIGSFVIRVDRIRPASAEVVVLTVPSVAVHRERIFQAIKRQTRQEMHVADSRWTQERDVVTKVFRAMILPLDLTLSLFKESGTEGLRAFVRNFLGRPLAQENVKAMSLQQLLSKAMTPEAKTAASKTLPDAQAIILGAGIALDKNYAGLAALYQFYKGKPMVVIAATPAEIHEVEAFNKTLAAAGRKPSEFVQVAASAKQAVAKAQSLLARQSGTALREGTFHAILSLDDLGLEAELSREKASIQRFGVQGFKRFTQNASLDTLTTRFREEILVSRSA